MKPSTLNAQANAVVDCQSLSKNYGKTRALANVSLQLPAGAPIALIGPNGAGKTTFLSLLCGFIHPSQGSVSVLGHPPGSTQALRKIAALPQDAWLDPTFTIARQLRHYAQLRGLSKSQAHSEPLRVLERVQLADSAQSKPAQLSHGMRKRIMIAQALIGQPQLVLLDEPTAGIDPPNVKIIRELIAAEADNATFIISSHNLDELEKVCDSVVHLAKGQLQGINSINAAENEGYITIAIRHANSGDHALDCLNAVTGVNHVTRKGSTDFVVEFNSIAYPSMDITLLTALAQQRIDYRRLTKGRSLEEQMFS
ncbi:hypothetical protein AB833_04100 [Chromatiales bacterium (ex Bugula neritina AB1)]|nr:hypothetical protein AB833_04100 [Chromatiales bacterium (ex Bugula neritina AB1)]